MLPMCWWRSIEKQFNVTSRAAWEEVLQVTFRLTKLWIHMYIPRHLHSLITGNPSLSLFPAIDIFSIVKVFGPALKSEITPNFLTQVRAELPVMHSWSNFILRLTMRNHAWNSPRTPQKKHLNETRSINKIVFEFKMRWADDDDDNKTKVS